NSGTPLNGPGPEGFTEYFRLRHGQVEETQYSLVSQSEVATNGFDGDEGYLRDPYAGDRGYFGGNPYGGGYFSSPRPNIPELFQGWFVRRLVRTAAPPRPSAAERRRL